MGDLTPDFSKRDCLLPAGCVDLLDVLSLTAQERGNRLAAFMSAVIPDGPVFQTAVIEIGPVITVHELADKIGSQPHKVLEKLIGENIFPTNEDLELTFAEAAQVLRAMGFCVKEVE